MGRPQKVEQVRRPAFAINTSHCFREKEQVNENRFNTDIQDCFAIRDPLCRVVKFSFSSLFALQ